MEKLAVIKQICCEQCYLGKWQNRKRKHIYDTGKLPNPQVTLVLCKIRKRGKSSESELEFCCQGRDKNKMKSGRQGITEAGVIRSEREGIRL